MKILGAKRFRTSLFRSGEQSGAQGSAHGQANHDEGNIDVAATDEEAHNRREEKQHDQIMERNLSQRVRGVSVCQIAPDKNHGGGGSGTENNPCRRRTGWLGWEKSTEKRRGGRRAKKSKPWKMV